MGPISGRPDFLIIGGGIVGITVAMAVKRRFARASVTLLEKEPVLGAHASGRNSGVLHAGFYYGDDSLKARFSREGNRRLTDYCLERGLRINRCGKLVVATREEDLPGLAELERRAQRNGVPLESVTQGEVRRIEPRVRTVERALFSPTTSSVDPVEVVASLAADARALGVETRAGVAYRARTGERVVTSAGELVPGYLINAAGLYADTIAHQHGFGERYRILPFKGLYLYADPGEQLRTNVYGVPDLRNPFAGVHFGVTVDNRVKIGPTAIPALWREQYGWRRGFRLAEFTDIVRRELGLLAKNPFGFRDLALAEARKYRRRHMLAMAARMVPDLDPRRYRTWGPPGIRAQLLDIRESRLVMDFVLEGDDRSMHILNAVSPAFTSALAFADHVADQIAAKVERAVA
jgi:L-2-hydroxyglutarate oxidase